MHITLNLTHACNLACSYCFAGEARAEHMPASVGRDAIDWAIGRALAFGDRTVEISFFGGEPLLAWDRLIELIQYARARGRHAGLDIGFQTTTNGTLLTDDRLDTLAEHGVAVALSIDGLPEAHDRTRPRRGGQQTGAMVWNTLDRALKRLRHVSIIHVVDPENVAWLGESVAAFLARGVGRVVLNPNWTAGWPPASRERWRDGYQAVAGHYVESYRAQKPFALNVFDEKIDLRIRGGGAPVQECGFDLESPAVAPSGRVYTCGRGVGEDRDGARACGNLAAGVPEVLDATNGHRPDACRSCAHLARCASRCACANREATGDPHRPGEILCWHERMAIPIADRAASILFAERNSHFLRRFYGGQEVLHALGTS